jgi:hypothetical protein
LQGWQAVAEQNHTKGVIARLWFCIARAAEGGEAFIILLGAVKIAFLLYN